MFFQDASGNSIEFKVQHQLWKDQVAKYSVGTCVSPAAYEQHLRSCSHWLSIRMQAITKPENLFAKYTVTS